MNEIQSQAWGSASPFDTIRRSRPDGSEYWMARELMPLQGYGKWERFASAIDRAKIAAANTGVDVSTAFVQVTQLPGAGNLGDQRRYDYELSRFACYLVAMNGDPRKPEVARAQAYFAVRAREAETRQESVSAGSTVPVTVQIAVNALAEVAHNEHVVPAAARILAFKRWRKPRKGIETGVQLAIDLSLLGIDAARFDVRALPARDAAR